MSNLSSTLHLFVPGPHKVSAGGGFPGLLRQLHALRIQLGGRQLALTGLCHRAATCRLLSLFSQFCVISLVNGRLAAFHCHARALRFRIMSLMTYFLPSCVLFSPWALLDFTACSHMYVGHCRFLPSQGGNGSTKY